MSTSIDAQKTVHPLRISSELDIIGDVTAIVAHPSELLAGVWRRTSVRAQLRPSQR